MRDDRGQHPVPTPALLEHADFVRSLSRSLVLDEDRADDVAQETWLCALERPPRHGASLRRWLAIVARNVARQAWRGETRRARRERACASPERDRSALEALEKLEASRALVRAVRDLSPANRTAVVMRYYDGLPPREIARRLGISTDAAKARLKRSLAELRGRLASPASRGAVAPVVLFQLAGLAPGSRSAGPTLLGSLIMTKTQTALLALVALVVVLVGVLLVSDPGGGGGLEETPRASRDAAPRDPATPDPAPAASDLEPAPGAAPAESGAAAGAPADSPPFVLATVRGRVVGERRFPVEGARAAVVFPEGEAGHARTDAGGRFVIEGIPRHETEQRRGGVLVSDGRGRAAVRELYLMGRESREELEDAPRHGPPDWRLDVGVIALEPARALEVRVVEGAAPVEGAWVRIESGLDYVPCGGGRTDAEGRFRIAWLPDRGVTVRARAAGRFGEYHGALPGRAPVVVDLRPARSLDVVVREAGSGLPLEGASVELQERRHVAMENVGGGFAIQHQAFGPGAQPTDAEGRTRLEGVPEGLVLDVVARKPGYAGPVRRYRSEHESRVRVPAGASEVEVELAPIGRRTVRVPVVDGESPVPPDGTQLRIREPVGAITPHEDLRPHDGRMEGGAIVVEGVPDGTYHAQAVTPDDTIARLFVADGEREGRETSFRPSRTITARVFHADGTPAAGASVTAHNQGNNPLTAPVRTDATGTARLEHLHANLAGVYAAPRGEPRHRVSLGSVDLERGDGTVEGTLPGEGRLTLQLQIDGAAALPPVYRVRVGNGGTFGRVWTEIEEERPEEGTCVVRFPLDPGSELLGVVVVAQGFLSAQVEVEASRADLAVPVVVPLERAGAIVADVTGSEGTRVELVVEPWKEEEGSWDREAFALRRLERANTPEGAFRFEPMAPGRYRVVDRSTGLMSEAVTLPPGGAEARVALDLAATRRVRGRVEGPPGADLGLARVLLEAPGIAPVEPRGGWDRRPGVPPGYPVRRAGEFEITVPTDRPVTIRAWHPVLAPAEEGGSVSLGPSDDEVVLRLDRGNEAWFAVPQGAGRRERPYGVRVRLYEDGDLRRPYVAELFAPVEEGVARFGGFEPGRYTVWVDPETGYAPAVLHDVELDAGSSELAVPFSPGSAIRVQVLAKEGNAPPRIVLTGFREEEPSYHRHLNSRGEEEVVLEGFGPGLFRVRYFAMVSGGERHETTVSLDGATDALLVLDLR